MVAQEMDDAMMMELANASTCGVDSTVQLPYAKIIAFLMGTL